mgnify:CR=1 FL=1
MSLERKLRREKTKKSKKKAEKELAVKVGKTLLPCLLGKSC